METLQLTGLLLIFVVMTLMMFYRVLPALLALPLMAIMIALVGGVYPDHILTEVIGKGSVKMHGAYTIAMFGGMLSVLLQKNKVAETMIKKGAELAGDNPWTLSVLMLLLIVLLFSTLGGLGSIIMVATIILPVLTSVGVGGVTCVGIFLLGISIGGTLNVGNWALYTSVLNLTVAQIRPFALAMFGLMLAIALIYITIQLYLDGHDLKPGKIARNASLALGLLLSAVGTYYYVLDENAQKWLGEIGGYAWLGLKWGIGLGMVTLTILVILRAVHDMNTTDSDVHWSALLAPVVPLVLILLYSVDFVSAFIAGLLYTFVATYRKGKLNLLTQACLEGAGVVMPAVILMFGIGMLLVAIMGPGGDVFELGYPNGWPVLNMIKPMMVKVIPTNPITYVLVFTIMAPLALYRGPLNVWGMGYGMAAVFLASGMSPGSVMGVLMAVGQVQGISDPTNTQNVWLANELRVDVNKILYNTIPYTWGAAACGLVIAAFMFVVK